MRVFEYTLMTGGNMSGNLTSSSQNLIQMQIASIQAVWTGSPIGALSLNISNDNVNWTAYTGSTTVVNGAGNFIWNLLSNGYNYVQVVYAASSGSGSLNITVSGKGN